MIQDSPPKKTKRPSKKSNAIPLPAAGDWRSTDEIEVLRRIQRARDEKHSISNLRLDHAVFSTFAVKSPSGMEYQVEIRDLATRAFSCTCPDFRRAGLGTCKHVESVLIWIKRRHKGDFALAMESTSPHLYLVPAGERLRIERDFHRLPATLRGLFDTEGNLSSDMIESLPKISRSPQVRISQEVEPFIQARQRATERINLRRDYETGVVEGRHPEHVTLQPLYPYQREGMLHLAFKERAMIADEMGLGKTIQAIAACALLHHLGKAKRVLIVSTASLKSEWEEQIRRFSTHSLQLVFGPRTARLNAYCTPEPPFFTIVNYEQVVTDTLDINHHLKPDIVVLDEAQRIKNWATKTAQAVKRLSSRFAFVLTGTPIENRIDELYSIVDFLDPTLLGSLFRFNRDFYQLDEKGRPKDYKNLATLRERVRPILLRRRKRDVETELPIRTDRQHFIKLTQSMRNEYDELKQPVSQILQKASRRTLTKKESDLLMIMLNMMRMICDTPSIIKGHNCQDCPKLDELAVILDNALADADVKVIVFSEWEGMLKKVRLWAEKIGIGFAWHTGSVPQQKRRAEIMAFRNDPHCRIFLSTDSGGIGLNLQNASVVINCDLPWNPARLEQRIARAWRKHQKRPVTVINLIAENTIESAMLETLATKMTLAEGVLDGSVESLSKAKLKRGNESNIARLKQYLSETKDVHAKPAAPQPTQDPVLAFAQNASSLLGQNLLHCQEAMLPGESSSVVLTVLRDTSRAPTVSSLFHETDWLGSVPKLHVIDESTWNSLQRLAEIGLITLNTRATRHLSGKQPSVIQNRLTPQQIQRITDLRTFASKKQKVAQLLIAEGLAEEATALQNAAQKALDEANQLESS